MGGQAGCWPLRSTFFMVVSRSVSVPGPASTMVPNKRVANGFADVHAEQAADLRPSRGILLARAADADDGASGGRGL